VRPDTPAVDGHAFYIYIAHFYILNNFYCMFKILSKQHVQLCLLQISRITLKTIAMKYYQGKNAKGLSSQCHSLTKHDFWFTFYSNYVPSCTVSEI